MFRFCSASVFCRRSFATAAATVAPTTPFSSNITASCRHYSPGKSNKNQKQQQQKKNSGSSEQQQQQQSFSAADFSRFSPPVLSANLDNLSTKIDNLKEDVVREMTRMENRMNVNKNELKQSMQENKNELKQSMQELKQSMQENTNELNTNLDTILKFIDIVKFLTGSGTIGTLLYNVFYRKPENSEIQELKELFKQDSKDRNELSKQDIKDRNELFKQIMKKT